MSLFAGKQKALMGGLASFGAALLTNIAAGGELSDLITNPATVELGAVIADLSISAIFGVIGYAMAYFKPNVAADGTHAKFVKPSGVVVDTQGEPVGTMPRLKSPWLVGVAGLAILALLVACDGRLLRPSEVVSSYLGDFCATNFQNENIAALQEWVVVYNLAAMKFDLEPIDTNNLTKNEAVAELVAARTLVCVLPPPEGWNAI